MLKKINGSTIIEFALALSVFFLITISLIELGIIGFQKVSLDNQTLTLVKKVENAPNVFVLDITPHEIAQNKNKCIKDVINSCEEVKNFKQSDIKELCNKKTSDCAPICKFWLTAYNIALSEDVITNEQVSYKYFDLKEQTPCLAKIAVLLPGFKTNEDSLLSTKSLGKSLNSDESQSYLEIKEIDESDSSPSLRQLILKGGVIKVETGIYKRGIFSLLPSETEGIALKSYHDSLFRIAVTESHLPPTPQPPFITPTIDDGCVEGMPCGDNCCVGDTYCASESLSLCCSSDCVNIGGFCCPKERATANLLFCCSSDEKAIGKECCKIELISKDGECCKNGIDEITHQCITTPTFTITSTESITNTVTKTPTITDTITDTITKTPTITDTITNTITKTPTITKTITNTPLVLSSDVSEETTTSTSINYSYSSDSSGSTKCRFDEIECNGSCCDKYSQYCAPSDTYGSMCCKPGERVCHGICCKGYCEGNIETGKCITESSESSETNNSEESNSVSNDSETSSGQCNENKK